MFYPMMDWTMIVLIPGILLALWAQNKVKSTFAEYSQVRSRKGITGREAARAILTSYGLGSMPINPIAGQLTDHYDPQSRSLSLSEPVYDSTSIAAIGVKDLVIVTTKDAVLVAAKDRVQDLKQLLKLV